MVSRTRRQGGQRPEGSLAAPQGAAKEQRRNQQQRKRAGDEEVQLVDGEDPGDEPAGAEL